MIRRFGSLPQRAQKYRIRHGVYAVLPKSGSLLLTFQAAPIPEFQLPGGGIDCGESPLAALHREVAEETGWAITRPVKLGVFRRFTFMPDYELWAEKICHIYCASPVFSRQDPTEENHTAVFVPMSEAPALLSNAGDRSFASRFL